MQNPNYKNGIKNLTEKQMKTSLPAYKMMIDKIKRTREEASLINKAALLENDFETMKYDQIFSLLGGRGAGKTSMLLTIYNELKTNDENILLPIIMPELIDEDEDILSWLLSAMKINLNEIEANILDLGHENKSDKYKQMLTEYNFFERCTFNNNNLLRKSMRL